MINATLINMLTFSKYGVEVIFVKVDGTVRTMVCTLNKDLMKDVEIQEQETESSSLTVYDLEKQALRRFRFDSIVSVRQLDS